MFCCIRQCPYSTGTDESSELEMENRQRLNSTLLDDGFAKNIDELKGFMDVSPILKEGEFCWYYCILNQQKNLILLV